MDWSLGLISLRMSNNESTPFHRTNTYCYSDKGVVCAHYEKIQAAAIVL